MSYIKDNFCLENKTAEKLYKKYAKGTPIFDYHCHLSEKAILENRQFKDIFEVWLGGDHYKWRLMRNYGVPEEYITGNKPNKEKFKMYCKTLGTAFGNPLYHWSQCELQEYFNCDLEINEANADRIWDQCNAYIIDHELNPQKVIEASNVKIIFTTNEIFDDLSTFSAIKTKNYKFQVLPAFRADKIMNIEARQYNEFVDKLGNVKNLDDLEKAIEGRLQAFIAVGCVASDISVQKVYPVSSKKDANEVFVARRKNKVISSKDSEVFKGYLTYFLMKLYSKYDIRTELHVGAMRNNNTEQLLALGLDTGYDSIADDDTIQTMSRLFDKLQMEHSLPKCIVFNLNPKQTLEIVSLLGCFQDGSIRGKMQYGPAWWFLDNKVGMERHLKELTSIGHLGAFVGMLTDSRSFLSYPRHHYFRRILCNYLGDMMEKGLMTNDINLVGQVVEDISYNNAINYFGMR